MNRKQVTIDATNKIAGRLASEVAVLLMGKDRPDYQPDKDMGAVVNLQNVDKIKFSGNKLETKKYYRHTGYIGNLKTTDLKKIFKDNPERLFTNIVRNMLPDNRLRKGRLKRLKFTK